MQKCVLQSSTGSGKTYLMLVRLANDPAFFKLLNIERIVYLCPTNSLGQQQSDAHKIPFLSSVEKVNAFVYISKGAYRNKTKIAELAKRFTAFTNGETPILSADFLNHDYNLQAALRINQKVCDFFNAQPEAKGQDDYVKTNDYAVLLNPSTNVYEVDVLRIFHQKEVQLQSLLKDDVVAFFAELKAVNPHVEIQDLEVVALEKDSEVRGALTDICMSAIIEKDRAAMCFSDARTESAAFTIAYFEAKSKETRQQIETFLGRKPLPTETESAREKLAANRVGDGVFLTVASQYLELIEAARHVKYANGVQPIKRAEIRQNLPFILRGPSDVKNRLERLAERLTADRELTPTRENIPVILAGRISNAIRAQVFKQPSASRTYSK
jgi:hypothetical protein